MSTNAIRARYELYEAHCIVLLEKKEQRKSAGKGEDYGTIIRKLQANVLLLWPAYRVAAQSVPYTILSQESKLGAALKEMETE